MIVMVNIHARKGVRDNYFVDIFATVSVMEIHHALHVRASAIIIVFIQDVKRNVAAR